MSRVEGTGHRLVGGTAAAEQQIPRVVALGAYPGDPLQFRYSALLASLILGVLWAFWHLPFVVTGEDIWIDALLFPIEWSIVYTWLFNNAKGSVLIVMLFHAMNNTFSSGFVGQMFSGADSVNQAWLRLILWGVVAIVLVVAAPSTCRASIKSKWNRLSLKQLRRPANDD